jgi:hypothetical protein
MRRALVLLLPIALVYACARERPPPRACEPPPPQKKNIRIGTCPIDWGHDAAADALDKSHEAGADAPHDG